MLTYLAEFLKGNPVALLFAVLGLGYLVGRTKIKGFELGSISGVLFVGLFFGHYGYTYNATVQSIGFVLFIFSVGLQAGPSFFSVLRKDGAKYFALAVVIALTGFSLALTFSKLLGLEHGAAAGLLAGGLTSSPTLAAAQEAVHAGDIPLPPGLTADQVMTNVTTSYAITYIFGLVGLIMIIRFLPRLTGVDLAAEAADLAAKRTGGAEDRAQGLKDLTTRAYRMTNPELAGRPVGDILEALPGRVSVEKVRRRDEYLPVTPDLALELDDEICIVAFQSEFAGYKGKLGPELSDPELLDVSLESCRIVLLRGKARKALGKVRKATTSLEKITARFGCFVSKVERLGVDIPLDGEIEVQAGDVIHVTGPAERLKEVGEMVGHIERETVETDLVTFAIGITVGLIVGALSVSIAGISVGLGTAGGLLTAGLVIGYLRVLHPTFGRVPGAARWIFMEMGLMMFMAGVGVRAGSDILETLAASGFSLFLAGITVTSVPVFVGYFFGRAVLSLNPVFLLGAITGSMTSGASLSIVTGAARSPLPALGYTGAYAFANVLLTVAGSVILLF
jgi:putative transport protein